MRNRLIPLIALLFFTSGFTSLMLQTSWNRILAQVIGIDFESQIVVVSIFMLGLGLGSYFGGLITRLSRQPLYFFASAEIAISVFAFFSDNILRFVQEFLTKVTTGNFGTISFLIDFIGYTAVLVVPIILMGTSLPIVIHSVRKIFPIGIATGNFYGINLFGAAVGSLVSGVYLLGELGIRGVLVLVSCVNLLLSMGFFLIIRKSEKENSILIQNQTWKNKHRVTPNIKLLAFSCGFISIGFEVLFFRMLTFFFGAKSYIFPLALSAFLLHVMIGSLISSKLLIKNKLPEKSLSFALITATILSLLPFLFSKIIVLLFPKYGIASFVLPDNTSFGYLIVVWFCVFVLMSCVIPISMAFPLVVSMNIVKDGEEGSAVSSTYFLTTLGNFIAALVVGAALIPQFGVIASYWFLIISILLLLIYTRRKSFRSELVRISLYSLASLLVVIQLSNGFYSTAHYKFEPPIRVHNELNGTILVYPTLDEQGVVERFRMNSGSEPATSFNIFDRGWKRNDHKIDASIAALGYSPSRILVIGVGTGDFLIDINYYFPTAKIVIVELYDSVIKEMLLYGSSELKKVLSASEIHILDGARYMNHLDSSQNANKFDFIQIGISHVTAAGAGNLFTREFLAKASKFLTRDGVISINAYAPVVSMLKADNKNFFIYSVGNGYVADLFITFKENSNKDLLNRFKSSYQVICNKLSKELGVKLIDVAPSTENFIINGNRSFNSKINDIHPLTYNNLITDHFVFQRISIPGQIDPRAWGSDYASIYGKDLREAWDNSCTNK